MTRRTAKGRLIGAQTREWSIRLARARVDYWRALLARPQLAGPIVDAVRADVDTEQWDRRLSVLVTFGRAMIETRRRDERLRYERACERAAEWLATIDRGCGAANACHLGIALWSGRVLPSDHLWHTHRIYPARVESRAWQRYWSGVTVAKRERERWRNAIVVANEGLVVTQVRKWERWAADGHLSRDDLQQAAREGMFRAADLYEANRVPPRAFSTYAAWWIQHHVFRLHQQHRSDVRAPIAIQALALEIGPIVTDLDTRDPREILAALVERWTARGKQKRPPTIDAVRAAMTYMGARQVSFDAPLRDGESGTMADFLPDPSILADEAIDRERILARLLQALDGLDPDDRQVIRARFGLDHDEHSAADLARVRGQTRRAIEEQERRAMAALRAQMGDLTEQRA